MNPLDSSLAAHSIALIREHQHPGGAYVASPNFDIYAYSWLRDGSHIAHAMARSGQAPSAAAFHRWVGGVLRRYDAKLADLTARRLAGERIDNEEQMHCRFTLEGLEGEEEWGNFQLDGYGTWLWALGDYVARTGDRALAAELAPQVERLVHYLRAMWQEPCYDWWEEFGDEQHTATLAALHGGLAAAAQLYPALADGTPAAIRAFVLEKCVVEGRLAKFVGSPLVDASLLSAAVPYGLLELDHPVMRATLARIERDLLDQGVHRYAEDVYYGGGEWLLLTAWLGWLYVEAGEPERARTLLDWVASQADAEGNLPEQVTPRSLFPEHVQPWIEKWGAVACPLLWSHAMYLVLIDALTTGTEAE